MATGAAVSVGGPIGFVGIVIPHLVRLLVGADHRVVLPSAILFGAAFLVGCDLIARTVMAPIELPVGIVGDFGYRIVLMAMQKQVRPELRDDGSPNLIRHRRAIVQITKRDR